MKKLLTILLTIFLFGCLHTEKESGQQLNTIQVGDYLFDFPIDFKLVEEKGIDSYVGIVRGDSMCFGFDFGYYSSNFEQTPVEYLDKGHWRLNLPSQFMKEGITYDQTNLPKVSVLNIRPATLGDSALGGGSDYIARCKLDKTEFDYAVYIPEEIKQLNFAIDTFDRQYRKIVIAKDPQKGTTGIYIRDLNRFSKSVGNYLALSMATSKLTMQQQEIALKIFRTGRRKNATK
jgi:hypothetical protein